MDSLIVSPLVSPTFPPSPLLQSSSLKTPTQPTKLGLGQWYLCPVNLSSPVLRLKEKTFTESLSWLATIKNWPDWSNWK